MSGIEVSNNSDKQLDSKPEQSQEVSSYQIRSALNEALSYCRFGHCDFLVSKNDIPKITEMLEKALIKEAKHHDEAKQPIPLISSLIGEGISSIVQDSFNECLESPHKEKHPIHTWPFYFGSWLIRAFILLPIRACIFFLTMVVFAFLISAVKILYPFDNDLRQRVLLKLYEYAAKSFVISFGGEIHEHGKPVPYHPGQIYVANHTTTIEVAALSSVLPFGLVGQQHTGIEGFVEKNICSPVQPLMFERLDKSQRKHVSDAMKAHVFDPKIRSPLLIFPEGCCVNNKYIMQFKKGAFMLGAEVCPIAIKYRDCSPAAYHNSKEKNFPEYLLSILMQPKLECDMWFLPPEHLEEGETPDEFAHRVQMLIANTAGLIPREWDGMLKYINVSPHMISARKLEFAKNLGIGEFEDNEASSMSIHVSAQDD